MTPLAAVGSVGPLRTNIRTTAVSQENPFESFFDFQKFFSPSQVPGVSLEAWSHLYQKNLEALDEVNKVMAAGFQACAEKQAVVLQQAFTGVGENFQRALEGKASDNDAATAIAGAGGSFEEALSNLREIAEIVTRANVEAMNIVQQRLGESIGEINEISAPQPTGSAPKGAGKATYA